jgi:hypothetical protein
LEWYWLFVQQARAAIEDNVVLQAKIDALVRENTEIRELFRVGGVTDELHEVRARMEALVAKVNTAKVLPLRKAAVA